MNTSKEDAIDCQEKTNKQEVTCKVKTIKLTNF